MADACRYLQPTRIYRHHNSTKQVGSSYPLELQMASNKTANSSCRHWSDDALRSLQTVRTCHLLKLYLSHSTPQSEADFSIASAVPISPFAEKRRHERGCVNGTIIYMCGGSGTKQRCCYTLATGFKDRSTHYATALCRHRIIQTRSKNALHNLYTMITTPPVNVTFGL